MNKETELKPCREEFEAWAALGAQPYDIALTGDDKYYVSDETQNAWLGFQAAYTQLQAENVRLLKAMNEADKQIDFGNVAYAKAAIKAALQHNEAL